MGVERVRDVDVMPINPTENLPATYVSAHSNIVMNGHAMVDGQAIQHSRGGVRDGPPARGPAAGRAQQEARAAAAAAQALSQESDMHTLSEVGQQPCPRIVTYMSYLRHSPCVKKATCTICLRYNRACEYCVCVTQHVMPTATCICNWRKCVI